MSKCRTVRVVTDYPAMPPLAEEMIATPPRSLHPVIYLLIANLGVSILLSVAVLVLRHSVVDFQVNHQRLRTDSALSPARQLDLARTTASIAIWSRVAGNLIIGVVYWFLVRSLLRGKRRAYLRVLWLSIVGIVSLVFLWTKPYPSWIRIEQVLQAFLLLAILYRVTRPEVRAYFAKPRGTGRRGGRFVKPPTL
jgi:hypothetical protein